MQSLDIEVIDTALDWARRGEPVWLCTVLATYGSSPREPGSMLVACRDGHHVGSLSGGCVEEDFLARLRDGAFDASPTILRYGDTDDADAPAIGLPCGGILDVLIERLPPVQGTISQLERLHAALRGQSSLVRCVDLASGRARLEEDDGAGPRVMQPAPGQEVQVRIGPATRLVIAGLSPVALACVELACGLGYEVIVCDPRPEAQADFAMEGATFEPMMPSTFIAGGGCHAATAVVALTHDPRIDDLAMMEAVRTPAFYIGVMGSQRTSRARAERLRRSGGLDEAQIDRIRMPIGLALGSKTPAEIGLAVMADILRVRRGRPRDAL